MIAIERLHNTPSILQTNYGKGWCGPVAVSNSLMWLAIHGYSALRNGADSLQDHIDIARTLAGADYMNTGDRGTTAARLMHGIDRYIIDRGYTIQRLQYEGWRLEKKHSEYWTGNKRPSRRWIESGLLGSAVAWIQIGLYRHNKKTDEYVRNSGHFVTLIGCGVDIDQRPRSNTLIVIDPAAEARGYPSLQFAPLKVINTGTLISSAPWPYCKAKGFYRINNKVPSIDCCGIIDGVVLLELAPLEIEVTATQE